MWSSRQPSDLPGLVAAVSPALADYRLFRGDVDEGDEFIEPIPRVAHALPRWVVPGGADLAHNLLSDVLIHEGRWFLTIDVDGSPRYYARVHHSTSWSVVWFGEAWLAVPVRDGIAWLNRREHLMLDSEVRIVSSRLYEFSSLWLVDLGLHLIVSASQTSGLPTFELLREQLVGELLLHGFGSGHGAGGLVRE